jgi:hypothetical protein
MAMRGARRTTVRLVAAGFVGITGVLLASAPAAALPADPPPLTIPPVGVPPVGVPPIVPGVQLSALDLGLAPVTEALQPPLGTVGSLLVPPAAPPPTAPAPAPSAALPTTPAPAAAPAVPPAPPAPPDAGAAETPAESGAPSATPAPAAPAAEATASSRGALEAVTGAARSFTPLFLLAAAVACFLVVQGRLDSRDAKLVTAPVVPDVLEFR